MLNLQPRPLDSRSLAIHDRALACARRFLIAEADLLSAIMEVDKNRIYEKFALPALTNYCVKVLGLSDEVAGTFVRVGRKCEEVPELKRALEERKITLFKARVIAPVLTKQNHAQWIEKARELSKEKLEHEVAAASGKGTVRLKLVLTMKEMEMLKRCRELVSNKLGREATWGETVAEIAKVWIEKNDPLKKAARNLSASHNDPSRDGSPTRKLRLPAHIKHAVNRRDRGRCQARLPDGTTCGDTRWIHFHHVVPKSQGGVDSLDNLVTLCSAHHRQWHDTAH